MAVGQLVSLLYTGAVKAAEMGPSITAPFDFQVVIKVRTPELLATSSAVTIKGPPL